MATHGARGVLLGRHSEPPGRVTLEEHAVIVAEVAGPAAHDLKEQEVLLDHPGADLPPLVLVRDRVAAAVDLA